MTDVEESYKDKVARLTKEILEKDREVLRRLAESEREDQKVVRWAALNLLKDKKD